MTTSLQESRGVNSRPEHGDDRSAPEAQNVDQAQDLDQERDSHQDPHLDQDFDLAQHPLDVQEHRRCEYWHARGDPHVDVAIVGAGFGGLGTAARLCQLGRRSLVVLEQAADLGGTWRENTYPGAACDVPSHLYSFSFFPATWPRRFSRQSDILAYLHRLADAFELWPSIRFGSTVRAMAFDEVARRWRLSLGDGSEVVARVVVSAVGQLNRPAWPAVDGVDPETGEDHFAGPSWHSARWDHTVDLTGRRVAVVGTGASAIQFVPEVARQATATVVFQRSAPYVVPKVDRRYSEVERDVYRRLRLLQLADRFRIYLYGETLGFGLVRSRRWLRVLTSVWRRYMHAQVHDPELRRRCEPDYVMGCKRILFSNEWYSTLARREVELVTEPVAAVTDTGVRTASGAAYDVDAIVYGTGFATHDLLAPMAIAGRGGELLHDRWSAGAEAYLGMVVPGFPNLFLLYGPNTNLGSNSIIFMLESQIGYVLQALGAMEAEGIDTLDVRPEVHREFVGWVEATSRRTAWTSGCHSWYTTADGRNTNNWPSFTFLYRHRLRRFELLDYDVVPRRDRSSSSEFAAARDADRRWVPVRHGDPVRHANTSAPAAR